MIWDLVVRGVVALLLGGGGLGLGFGVGELVDSPGFLPGGLAGGLAGLVVGAVAAPYLVVYPLKWAFRTLKMVPISTLVLGLLGLIMGLVTAALLSISLGQIPGPTGWILPIVTSLVLGLLGALILMSREETLFEGVPALQKALPTSRSSNHMVLLDTSIIIDGRIADLVATGFLQGTLGVPQFILNELQHIADSSDAMRRSRGRRGLEVLNRLRREAVIPVQVLDKDSRDGIEVDTKLVQLAREIKASILTTDFNLNRVAEFQGVRVLNVNELANALKPAVLPGEEMSVRVIQEGREVGQGVGFLDDGTMVVIEGGKRYINSHLDAMVTRVLQTNAGRIIFAQPKAGL